MALVELRAGPFDRLHRLVVHALTRADRGAVVIADQRDCAALDEFPHGVDGKAWIRAIAHIVAEEHEAIDRATARVREARLERFAVAVDVGEQGDQHAAAALTAIEQSRSRQSKKITALIQTKDRGRPHRDRGRIADACPYCVVRRARRRRAHRAGRAPGCSPDAAADSARKPRRPSARPWSSTGGASCRSRPCPAPRWNEAGSIATSLAPMPRKPPTPTTNAMTLRSLSNRTSLTSPIFASSAPITSVPLNFEARC